MFIIELKDGDYYYYGNYRIRWVDEKVK
jgi:hypothetical protein